MGFRRKESSSTTTSEIDPNVIWNQVGIPAPDISIEDALLEANYAAYYGGDTLNETYTMTQDHSTNKTFDDILGNHRPTKKESNRMSYEEPITPWPGKFEPSSHSNWSNIPGTSTQYRSQSDVGHETPKVKLAPRSKSDAYRPETVYNVDLSTPWNPTFPPYSKFHTPPTPGYTEAIDVAPYSRYHKSVTAEYTAAIEEEAEEDESGVGRPVQHQTQHHRLSELIDPNELLDEQDPYGSFPGASSYLGYASSYGSRSSSLDRSSSRSSSRSRSPPSSVGNSRSSSRKPSLADSVKPLPPVLESPSGTLFSATEFVAHPNRPLAIRERQEHIRAAIQSLDAENRAARSESRKGSIDSGWKTGFGNDSRKGSMSGFGSDSRSGGQKTLEQMKIEEGRRAYEEKMAKKGGIFSAFRGRKASS